MKFCLLNFPLIHAVCIVFSVFECKAVESAKDIKRAEMREKAGLTTNGGVRLSPLPDNAQINEVALRQIGQLGGRLTPTYPADATNAWKPAAETWLAKVNRDFAAAMDSWNKHDYKEACLLFEDYLAENPTSPWAAEADLHLACYAQQHARWDEAQTRFDRIIASVPESSEMWNKAKMRRAVLFMDQGNLEEAGKAFQEVEAKAWDWERRTYSGYWLQRISLMKAHEKALRDCGYQSIEHVASVLGVTLPKDISREAVTRAGWSFADIAALAAKSGLKPIMIVSSETETLGSVKQLPVPWIAHYGEEHYVVVTAFDSDGISLFDSRLGRKTTLSPDEFLKLWSGHAMIFNPNIPSSFQRISEQEAADLRGGCCGIPPHPDGLGDPDRCLKTCRALPIWRVNPVNMNLVMKDAPMWWDAPAGPNIDFEITYNSLDALNQLRPFGRKWTFNYASYLMVNGAGMVTIVHGDGRGEDYQPDGSGGYITPEGSFTLLRKTGTYAFELEYQDGTIHRYDVPPAMSGGSTSQLLSITDRFGTAVTITHNANGYVTALSHSLVAGQWTLDYNNDSLVTAIHDPFGRTATFSYTLAPGYSNTWDLTGQTDMGDVAYGYSLDADGYLTWLSLPDGDWSFYTEPADTSGNSIPTGFQWDNSLPGTYLEPMPGVMWQNYRITVTDPKGYKEKYYFDARTTSKGWFYSRRQYNLSTQKWGSQPDLIYQFSLIGTSGSKGKISRISYLDGSYLTNGYDSTTRKIINRTTFVNAIATYYHIEQATFSTKGRVETSTDANSQMSTYYYAPNGLDLIRVKDPTGVDAVTITYHSSRLPHTVKDRWNRTTTYLWNSLGQPTNITNAAGEATELIYNPQSHWLSVIKRSGIPIASLKYDSVGRVIEVDNVDGDLLSHTYNGLNRRTSTTYGNSTSEIFNWGCCRIEGYTDQNGNSTAFEFDSLGNLIKQTRPDGSEIRMAYDPVGFMTDLWDADNRHTQWSVNESTGTVTKTYADGSQWITRSDILGRVFLTDSPLLPPTWFLYDPNGNLIRYSDSTVSDFSFQFDGLNRMKKMTDNVGASGITTWTYSTTQPQVTEDGPLANDTIIFTLDAAGRPASRSVNGVAQTWGYDTLGRLSTAANPLGAFAYAYEGASGRVASATLPGILATNYQYGDVSEGLNLEEILHQTGPGQLLSRHGYTHRPGGGIATWAIEIPSANTQWNLEEDALSQLTRATRRDAADGSVLARDYSGYDGSGNRVNHQIDEVVTSQSHNSVNQLVSSTGGGKLRVEVELNEPGTVSINGQPGEALGGNRYAAQVAVVPGANSIGVTATDPQNNADTKSWTVTQPASAPIGFTYDLNGNLAGDGGRTYEYGFEDRLKAINEGNKRTEFTYDGMSRRVRMVEKVNGIVAADTRFVWSGLEIVEARNASTNAVLKRYYPQGWQQTDGQGGWNGYYYTRDHLGSVREVLDGTGTVRSRYSYSVWGERTKLSGDLYADFGYTGHFVHSGTGLVLAPFREYDAELGRWLSRDPIGEAGGINLYGYVANNPARFLDPVGLAPDEPYKTEEAAASAALADAINASYAIYPRKREFGGNIYIRPDKQYSYTPLQQGEWDTPKIKIKNECQFSNTKVADYHSHYYGLESQPSSNIPDKKGNLTGDTNTAVNTGYPQYTVGNDGRMWRANPKTGSIDMRSPDGIYRPIQ